MAKSTRKRRRKKGVKRKRGAAHNQYYQFVADAGVFCLMALIGLAGIFVYFSRDLPDTSSLWRDDGAPKITLLAADGSPLLVRGSSVGEPLRLSDLPPHAPQAILAVEDRNFYHHLGMNPIAIMRALIVNARHGEVRQGGSTITQQLAKNVFLTSERTLKRKVQELMLAVWLEQKFSKDEILTLYVNRVYFGAGAYGIDAASYRYFGKSARYLSLGEAAVLAGLLKAPSRFAPTSNPINAGRRGRLVVEQMVDAGFLNSSEAASVLVKPVLISNTQLSAAPYFVDYVLQEAERLAGKADADLVVHTTIDPVAQANAELGLIAGMASASDNLEYAQSAVVIIDGGGAIKAMIGGRDYRDSQFNRAVQAQRQPGSAFKPIVFLAAMESGLTPDDLVLDAPLRIGKWSPGNYNEKYFGEVTLTDALARSLNGASIRVQEAVGRNTVRNKARDLGWAGNLSTGPALGLGVDEISPVALAGVYAPFANGGFRVNPTAILRIETSEGDVVYQSAIGFQEQAASQSSIDAVNEMMRAAVDWGTGAAAAIPGRQVSGKTGTSQASRDAWFAGHAAGFICVVWVGRDDNAPMRGVTGGRAPATIWREVMARALPRAMIAPLSSAERAAPVQ